MLFAACTRWLSLLCCGLELCLGTLDWGWRSRRRRTFWMSKNALLGQHSTYLYLRTSCESFDESYLWFHSMSHSNTVQLRGNWCLSAAQVDRYIYEKREQSFDNWNRLLCSQSEFLKKQKKNIQSSSQTKRQWVLRNLRNSRYFTLPWRQIATRGTSPGQDKRRIDRSIALSCFFGWWCFMCHTMSTKTFPIKQNEKNRQVLI